jgi:tRNA-Thr(GGU) m(6)t(6)A37 methyltransferase TsaA
VLITYRPIGIIRTPFATREGMPIQSIRSSASGRVEIYPQYRPALADLDGFSHIILLYHFHQSGPARQSVRPFLESAERGVFATRHPARPNPIGLSVVRLDRVEMGESPVLHVTGVDVLDGTPLLDIKPYVPRFDQHPATRVGWLEERFASRPWLANFDA